MASYRALSDIFTPGCGYAQAGQILADDGSPGAIPIPVGWKPPANAVGRIVGRVGWGFEGSIFGEG